MNRTLRLALAALLLSTACASTALACLWDTDTLAVERTRFPDAHELIAGAFPRHSEAFYHWRVNDRLQKIEASPQNASLHDDLAVAYDKLGEHEQAINTIRQVEQFEPGRYETYANLGTFLIHAGRLEEGKKYIEQAIEINPEAHFGREVWQLRLVEYVLSKQNEEGELSLPLKAELNQYEPTGFAVYVRQKNGKPIDDPDQIKQQVARALKGVLGMVRFGNHESPILMEVVGDLLLARGYPDDAKRLAARAYLKASYQTEGRTSKRYRQLAEQALSMQTKSPRGTNNMKLSEIASAFKQELLAADKLEKAIAADERRWIRTSADPEAEFQRKYLSEHQETKRSSFFLPWVTSLLILGAILLVLVAVYRFRALGSRRQATA